MTSLSSIHTNNDPYKLTMQEATQNTVLPKSFSVYSTHCGKGIIVLSLVLVIHKVNLLTMQYIGLLYQTQGDFEGDLENFILNSLVFYDKSILKVKGTG